MRKINPRDICDDFDVEITELTTFFKVTAGGIASDKDRSLLSELVFHRGYVGVEAFLSAWFAGSINQDSTVFLTHRKTRIETMVKI